MSSIALLLLCVQACLIQHVLSQYVGGYGVAPPCMAPYGYGAPGGLAGLPPQTIELGAYGGAGVGDVAVAGEMPVAGTTLVAGQVPILGAVRFAGDLPATGTVSISGNCGCGCNRAPYY